MQKREGTIKRGVQLSSGSLAAAIAVVWVFRHKFRVSTKPQTLYLSCLGAPRVGSIL